MTTLSDPVIDALNATWRERVTPVTGFDTYEALIASLA